MLPESAQHEEALNNPEGRVGVAVLANVSQPRGLFLLQLSAWGARGRHLLCTAAPSALSFPQPSIPREPNRLRLTACPQGTCPDTCPGVPMSHPDARASAPLVKTHDPHTGDVFPPLAPDVPVQPCTALPGSLGGVGWSLPWGMEGMPSGPHQVQIGLFLICRWMRGNDRLLPTHTCCKMVERGRGRGWLGPHT